MLDQKLLTILACPLCKGELQYDRVARELVCLADALAYPVRDDVPVMLSNEARGLTGEECEKYR
jgi:uncharacterized protein YbaR (Trm112 family)|tara:strand:- start:2299 stop:2490 length:192 start_codon:yes stop_codon:yes gene_type:complete